MPEWLVERGIGETRAALIEGGEIIEARIEVEGSVPAGSILAAQLTGLGAGGRNAVARDSAGREYLLPRAPERVTEGAALHIEVTREAIPGNEPWKRAIARHTGEAPRSVPELAERLGGRLLAFPPAQRDDLAEAGWHDLVVEAESGQVAFAGGSLRIALTPAMTFIDVDGTLPPLDLAIAAAGAAGKAIRRLDIGGSIGIDFPTVSGKPQRLAVGEALDAVLQPPFERTAVNGFGFMQVIRPRARASLLELWSDRANAEARALLRRAAMEPAGAKRLAAHPRVVAILQANAAWIEELQRQAGGTVSLRADPSLPMSGGYAEPA